MSSQKGSQTILWWVGWICLTILSFFVSCYFWTGFIAKNVGPIDQPGVSALWVAAVFGSWMVLLVPLIVVMYNKVDRAYEDSRISRETTAFKKAKESFKIKSVWIDPEQRTLSPELSRKLKTVPETLKKSHLVTVVLKNGRRIDNVFVSRRREVLGIYGYDAMPFQMGDIADLEPADLDSLPVFKTEEWLRLDGAGGNEALA